MANRSVFLSYRRDDVPDTVDRIFEALERALGNGACFMDVDTSALGADFRENILDALADCQVCLVVIGPGWTTAKNDDGSRRLDNTLDWVRIEVATALSAQISVIPVLARGAAMPRREEVPEDLAPLCYRSAATVRRNPDFDRDMDRLIGEIRDVLENPNKTPTIRSQFESLKQSHAELSERVQTYEEQRRAALHEVKQREQEVVQISERAAREIEELRAELKTAKREKSAARTALNEELSLKQKEATRLAELATAETATKRENEMLALAELSQQQNRAIRQQQYQKLQEFADGLRRLNPPAPPREQSNVKLPTQPDDYRGDDVFEDKAKLDVEARRIAAGLVSPERPKQTPVSSSSVDTSPISQGKHTNNRSARHIASTLAALQPTLDMGLAIHYATEIVQQQGIRIPLRFDGGSTPPLGHYAELLPERPRVAKWMVDVGAAIEQGDPIALIWSAGQIIIMPAPDNVKLISRLVEKHGYIPTSGVIGYLQPL